jgi:hypothetical protein
MKELYSKDLASYTDPESCTLALTGEREALPGASAGGLLSHDILRNRGAEVVPESGRLHLISCYGKRYGDLVWSKNPSMHRTTSRENWEIGPDSG